MIQEGDTLSVFPHGAPQLAAPATALIISKNQRSIAVAFGDMPPFVSMKRGFMVDPAHGVVMLATRAEIDGEPWGPWEELLYGGHYEMEKPS